MDTLSSKETKQFLKVMVQKHSAAFYARGLFKEKKTYSENVAETFHSTLYQFISISVTKSF